MDEVLPPICSVLVGKNARERKICVSLENKNPFLICTDIFIGGGKSHLIYPTLLYYFDFI
jgi:hypothetical protein